MIRSDSWSDGDIIRDLFEKIDEAETDADEIACHRCLEDVRELAISACRETMQELAPSSAKADGTTQSLEDFLHPVTFYLQLLSVEGRLQAAKIEDTDKLRQHARNGVPTNGLRAAISPQSHSGCRVGLSKRALHGESCQGLPQRRGGRLQIGKLRQRTSTSTRDRHAAAGVREMGTWPPQSPTHTTPPRSCDVEEQHHRPS